MRRLALLLSTLLLAAAGVLVGASLFTDWFQDDLPDAPGSDRSVGLTQVATGFDRPTFALGRSDGLYVMEQAGRVVRTTDDGRTTWLDLSGQVKSGGEQGLLGMAFSPDGDRLYVHYSDLDGDTVLSRIPLQDGTPAPDQEEVILQVTQPYSNHNGGTVVFGPDGYLYLGLGDGGLAGDPHGNGQDPHTLLGAILRLDVSGDTGYTIPPDNPFADGQDGAPEVWAYGLRNPWRFHFGPDGALWIGDVGQNNIEELDRIPAGLAGANLGWNHWEGSQPYGPTPDRTDFLVPVAEYDHDGGHCSITGGPPFLDGVVFGDYCSGTIWMVTADGDGWRTERLRETGLRISSFGEGPDGVYVVDHGGAVYRITAPPANPPAH